VSHIGFDNPAKVYVEFETLPASATKKKVSPGNWYYEVLFSIAIRFIMTLEFKVMSGRRSLAAPWQNIVNITWRNCSH
jgi:hypothetical protein